MKQGPRSGLVNGGETGGGNHGNGHPAYTDNKLWRQKVACQLCSSFTILSFFLKKRDGENEQKQAEKGKEREPPSLKEPVTCVHMPKWLDGPVSELEGKRLQRRRKDRNEKSNKSEWCSPLSAGWNARRDVNHDALTVRTGPGWHYTIGCLRFTIRTII